jgi:hypothetical protein
MEVASGLPTNCQPVPRLKDTHRSRVGNGSVLLEGADGRSPWVRRLKELLADHISDLGGDSNVSAAERAILRRACVMIVECERLERQFANAGEASADDLDCYGRISGNMRRLLEAVGLQRRPRSVNELSLHDIIREHERSQEAAE